MIDVEDPWNHDERDNAVITLVDKFLRAHNATPVVTVANTIFPQSLYLKYGAPDFYAVYHRDFDRLTETKRWGRYFERMTRHRTKDGETYNPLQRMIDKLRRQTGAGVRYKAAYELAVYDPLLDGRLLRGGQCLSFLSFKLHPVNGLMLTAMYRNHTYITRCLGNLIGLGQLQAFVAKEAGVKLGSLTCISTHAELDVKDGGWGIKDARDLVEQARRCWWIETNARRRCQDAGVLDLASVLLRGVRWAGARRRSVACGRPGPRRHTPCCWTPACHRRTSALSGHRRSTTRTGGSLPSARACSSAVSRAIRRPGLTTRCCGLTSSPMPTEPPTASASI